MGNLQCNGNHNSQVKVSRICVFFFSCIYVHHKSNQMFGSLLFAVYFLFFCYISDNMVLWRIIIIIVELVNDLVILSHRKNFLTNLCQLLVRRVSLIRRWNWKVTIWRKHNFLTLAKQFRKATVEWS